MTGLEGGGGSMGVEHGYMDVAHGAILARRTQYPVRREGSHSPRNGSNGGDVLDCVVYVLGAILL